MIFGLIAKIFTDLFGILISTPQQTGKVQHGAVPLEPSAKADVLARARRAGLLVCLVAISLGGCGVFDRKTEVMIPLHYPAEDWPDGVPILAETEVRILLKDGTIGTLKSCEGMQLWHPSDTKALLKMKGIPPLDDTGRTP